MRTVLLSQIAPVNRLLSRLKEAAGTATDALVAVAFATEKGAQKLVEVLSPVVTRGATVRVYLSGYMMVTHPQALWDLFALAKAFPGRLSVYFDSNSKFHYKFILLRIPHGKFVAFIGSSNLSVSAFDEEGELNVSVSGSTTDPFFSDASAVERHIAKDFGFRPLTKDVIGDYQKVFKKKPSGPTGSGRGPDSGLPRSKTTVVHADATLVSVPRVPIMVSNVLATREEVAAVRTATGWDDWIGWTRVLGQLNHGSPVVIVSKIDSPKCFWIARIINDDRVKGVGHVVGVRSGRFRNLSLLARWLNTTERALGARSGKYLKPFEVLILQERLPNEFR